ncbi:MAG: hypothetical protein RL000_1926 [Bacteroidota bacterium]|jgi:uncharacterized membrane protein/mono/diheme cytochrome c family protein
MIEFIGRLHPVFVHLPIGIFVLVVLLEFAALDPKRKIWSTTIQPINIIGIIFSFLSILTGLLLAEEGNNNEDDVNVHKWTAIATTVLFITYAIGRNKLIQNRFGHITSLILLSIGLISTGHLGGTLTHGADYLTIETTNKEKEVAFTVKDINQAAVYKDIVQYTLEKKCVQCHGADKQKGKLRLDDSTWVLTGGKNGQVVNQQVPEKSELLKRILLDLNDEKHMPPKGKNQLTEFEQAIFKWWIVSGASFNKHIAEMQLDDKTKNALNKFKEYYSEKGYDIKREDVASISKRDKLALEKAGWVIAPISNEDNHIRAVGYNLEQPLEKSIETLALIKEQLVELKLSSSGINDQDIRIISSLTNIEKLWLDGNKLTDQSLEKITTLTNLSYLNLSFTSISKNGIVQLKKLPALKNIYLYETKVSAEDLTKLKSEWKGVKIYGKDSMTVAPTDTLFTKPAK